MDRENASQISENVIVVDADFLDAIIGGFVSFLDAQGEEPKDKADLSVLLACLALDGGVRGCGNSVRTILIHDSAKDSMQSVVPSSFARELTSVAFQNQIGEFCVDSFSAEGLAQKDSFFLDSLFTFLDSSKIRRVMVVADMDGYGDEVMRLAAKADGKEVTLFSMRPLPDGPYRQDRLGYAMMKALGMK